MYEDLIDNFDPADYNMPLIEEELEQSWEAAGFDDYRERVLSKMSPKELFKHYIETFAPVFGHEDDEQEQRWLEDAIKMVRLDLQTGALSVVVTPENEGEKEAVVAFLGEFKSKGGFGPSDDLQIGDAHIEYTSSDIGGLFCMETDPAVLAFVDEFERSFADYAYTITVTLTCGGESEYNEDQHVWESKAAKKQKGNSEGQQSWCSIGGASCLPNPSV